MTLRENILAALEQSGDAPLSGQMLAARFGVSRSAVWKAVNALKDEGYSISSATNRGYRLEADSDVLSAQTIERLLDGRMPVYAYKSLDSTNSQARRLLDGGTACPFLVAAEAQTDGRGRRGRAFVSPAGAGLYMSVALRPGTELENAGRLTAYAAVCAAQAIEAVCGKRCGIKWVNDLFLDGKKVCGILSEAVTDFESGGIDAAVVGIGVNLHPFDVPEPLRDTVGFLHAGAVKNRLAAEIAARLVRFDAEKADFMDAYRRRSIVLGRTVAFTRDGAACTGTAAAIDNSGALHVRGSGGETVLRSGTIRLVETSYKKTDKS